MYFSIDNLDSIRILSSSQERFNMANKRLSKEKQILVLMALCEGMPIRAAARMFKVGKNAIHRLICETGEAFARQKSFPIRGYLIANRSCASSTAAAN
jgi:hypothetical protein